jgi:hypothetical protein
MKNVYEVLRQKEADRQRIESEIEALRVVIPLLEEKSNQAESDRGQYARDASSDTKATAEPVNEGERAPGGSWWKLASH